MSAIRSVFLAALTASALVVAATPSGAVPQVSIDSVTVSGDTATVSGAASFPPITEPHSVAGDEAVFGAGNVGGTAAGNAAGLDIQDATIGPLDDGSGLRFTWVVSEMPEQGIPPELVRYNWGFRIGERLYQLQAKSTNLVNSTTTEDPLGHVRHLATGEPFFQLRGNCVANYLGTPSPVPNINGCYHLAFLEGNVDPAAGTISVDLPFNTTDSIGRLVAPDFVPGAVLLDNGGEGTAGMVVAASFQAVVSNQNTSQWINGVSPYFIGPQVSLGVGRVNQFPASVSYGTPVTLEGETFTGSVSGLTATNDTVFVRACNGAECSYASFEAI